MEGLHCGGVALWGGVPLYLSCTMGYLLCGEIAFGGIGFWRNCILEEVVGQLHFGGEAVCESFGMGEIICANSKILATVSENISMIFCDFS